ncbi:TPA: hypothetical protein DEO28_04875 [Candidatus Dependentiae bacterium]|nr:MAG: Folylpolyglutamate synthase/dihydrofolate synthase [candidate division TM6 bacterium GW2011_GWE2_31_21]KKP53885.1 MAG: Folylpolyglutamate synthase/dihydrofolate synthase [candidate division TM6 bacterium GW2011_GWF2_33_332]HBS47665.1 hypothetical protein [Candidatus Dependentiae bacterium]HBZ73814.1 hypothetical protein [Candidatus Dependentiae bacterium]
MSINLTSSQKHKNEENVLGKNRSYNDVIEFLSAANQIDYSKNAISRMQELNKEFDDVASKLDIILIGGVNGKSLTINFAAKLLAEEGIRAGACYSSHILTYNERITLDSKYIQNKQFTDSINEVLNVVEAKKLKATAFEIVTMASLLYFKSEKVDVVFLEVGMGGTLDATNFVKPKISAVTQVSMDDMDVLGTDFDKVTGELMGIAKNDCYFISAEQSKTCLQKMKEFSDVAGAKWMMPIRKQSALPYIYEQLYGRTASLAERIALIYVENIKGKFSPFLRGNLLLTKQGQRGRPTLEEKKKAILNPVKTLKSFWNEKFELLRGRFELLEKEKPTIILDNAHNLDALANLFLGIRLLHYKKSINGFVLILGMKSFHDANEVVKSIRYLLKKISGQVFFVPAPGEQNVHNPEELCKLAKSFGIRANSYKSLNEAFEVARQAVDERQGLIAIAGTTSMVSEYWKNKDIKKFN